MKALEMNSEPVDWQRAYRQLADAFEAVPEGFALLDAEDRYVMWNQRYAEIYGPILETIAVGARFEDVVRATLTKGLILDAIGREEEWLAKRLAEHRQASHSFEHHMRNDRWVRADERRTADGGTVSVRTDITELKRAEARNREQKLQLDAAVDNIVQGLVMFDANERVVLVNQRYLEIYGLSPSVVRQGCTFLELMKHREEKGAFPGDAEARRQEALAHVAAGETWSAVRVLPDGRSVQGIHRPLADGSWVSTHEDITERQQAEAKLSEQKLQLDAAVNNMVQGLAMFDADARLVLVNQRYLEMYGLSSDIVKAGCSHFELVKHRKEMGVLAGDPKAHSQRRLANLAKGKPWSSVFDLPDGRSIQAFQCPMADGGWVSTHEDITERRQASAKNYAQKLQIDAAISNMIQGIVMFDADARLVLFNQRYIDMYGLSPDIVKAGCSTLELLEHKKEMGAFPDDPQAHSEDNLDRSVEGKPWTYVRNLPDGRSIQVVHCPLVDGGRLSTHEDITERQRAEADRQKAEVKIREQKLQLDAAVDNMAQGLVMFDAESRVVLWNQRYLDMYGLSPSIIREGCTFLELMNHREGLGTISGDAEANCQRVLDRLAEGKPWSFIHDLSDGRSVQTTNHPMPNGGWVSTHEDVTERQRAEAKDREQKLLIDAAVDNMTQGLVMFDGNSRVVLWNTRYIEMYGLSSDIVRIGCSHLELMNHRKDLGVFSGDPEVYRQLHLASLAGGKHWSHAVDLPDGRSIRVVNRPLSEGGWVSTHEDVTERQRTEVKIREQKLQLDAAVDNMAQGLVMFDAEARLVLWNQRYIQMYGLSPSVIKEGCTLLALMKHRSEVGAIPGDAEANCERVLARVAKGKPFGLVHDLSDGRSIQTVNSPMPGGGWVSTHEDITERQESQRQIEHLAHHDVLTGLSNRASFNEYLSSALESAAQNGDKLGILCIDLDRLKETNDVFGHAMGDRLLQRVAERFKSVANDAFVARLGGDEFSIVVPGGQQPAATADLAAMLQVAMAEEIDLDGQLVLAGVSIGVAIYPNDGTDAAMLMANGDAALYRAKSEGRGCICFFDTEMDKELRDRRLLQHQLRFAVEDNQLRLVYQPQARANGGIVGFEALVRWQHPTRGLIDPGVFIPLAEDNGLIMPLSVWVLREACREAATWKEPLNVAVNLSPIQFKHGDLPALVHSILLETGLAPQRLELELTESALVENFTRAISILRRLKALGVKIALDDFGTGYSSLSYLQSFPFDKIKIDRSFIADLDKNPRSPNLFRGVIGLAHGLSLPVLAEGVETPEQLAFAEQEACDEIQGFLIGQPMEIDAYAEVVGKAKRLGRPQAARVA